MSFSHKSVLLEETIEGLCIKPDGIYVDGTLGGGGHACAAGATLISKAEMKELISKADALLGEYKANNEGWL